MLTPIENTSAKLQTLNLNTELSMRNATASGNPLPTDSHPYSPAVPISLYREVAAELETTKTHLASVNAQNQHLVRENQQLRQEIEKIIQSSYRMQQVVNSLQPFSGSVNFPGAATNQAMGMDAFHPSRVTAFQGRSDLNNPFPSLDSEQTNSAYSEPLFTEEQEVRPRRGAKPQRASDLNGVWLVAAIVLIVISAFGAGYWVVRPILLKR